MARKKVDIHCFKRWREDMLKTVEDVPTLLEALRHSEYEAANNKEVPLGIRKKARCNRWHDTIKAEDKKEELKEEEKKESKEQKEEKKEDEKSEKDPFEIKKNEKDPFGEG